MEDMGSGSESTDTATRKGLEREIFALNRFRPSHEHQGRNDRVSIKDTHGVN